MVQLVNGFATMNQRANHNRFQIFSTLVLPIMLGLGMYLLLGLMIEKEVLTNELTLRYLVGHPISKCTTLLFFIGVSALLLIANNVFDQYCNYNRIALDLGQSEVETDQEPSSLADKADLLLSQLHDYRWSIKRQYLWQRLVAALGFVKRTGGTAGIEDELKYLSDTDRDRQHHRYSLVRILIWATPMLGFLGTVLGISQALGGIQVGADNDFQQMLNSLRGSLFVAFDTTALALTLSIVLMFIQFFTDRFESQLLDIVDRRTHEELSPLYQNSSPLDPQAQAMQEVGRMVLAGAQQVMQQQLELWQQNLKSSEDALTRSVNGFQTAVKDDLCESIQSAAAQLTDVMSQSTQAVDEQLKQRFEDWQQTLVNSADAASERWNQWQVLLSENARQMSQSQDLVSEQLHLTQEVLSEMNVIQNHLSEISKSQVELPPDANVNEPTLKVVSYDEAKNRLNHIYRFVTKPVEHSDAA